jgi:DNA-binding transcriptional ArsR family regulator
VPGLLALDPTAPAEVLATLAHPHRLRLLLALIDRPRTAAELQAVIGSSSPGPLYHHLRDLLALGVVVHKDRAYHVGARHVVPLLTAIAVAIDLGARRQGG